jgi:hypothetical protein
VVDLRFVVLLEFVLDRLPVRVVHPADHVEHVPLKRAEVQQGHGSPLNRVAHSGSAQAYAT